MSQRRLIIMADENLYEHLVKTLKTGTRFDGRKLTEFRPIEVETGVIKTADGSARVKIGDTEVLAGIKLEVIEPYPDTPNQGSIMVGAELLPLSNPNFEIGPPGPQAIEIARVVDRGIRESKALSFEKLCIEEGKKAWVVVIDVCTINDAGNLIDTSALAALAALTDTRFPAYDGEKIDYKAKTNNRLPLDNSEPVSVTVIKIGNNLLVDLTDEEEIVIDARLTINSKKDGTLCALQKGGDAPLTPEEIMCMVDIALEKAKELRGAL